MSDLLKLLREVGGVIDNSHVVYTSSRHGYAYVNWVAVLNDAKAARATSRVLARRLTDLDFGVIAGPTHTGDKLATALADAFLDLGRAVVPVYCQEKTEKRIIPVNGELREVKIVLDGRDFPRGQAKKVQGKQVLVVDELLPPGGSARETLAAVREAGGLPVWVAVFCNRSDISGEFDGLPLTELLNVPMEVWDPEECQACMEQVPMNTAVGHGSEWLAQYPDPNTWPAFVKAKGL